MRFMAIMLEAELPKGVVRPFLLEEGGGMKKNTLILSLFLVLFLNYTAYTVIDGIPIKPKSLRG